MMAWFKIYAGLSGGFGGARYQYTREYGNEDEAAEDAWREACEDYDGMAGLHGLRDITEIMEQDEVDEEEAEEIYNEEREGWIDYYVEPATGPDDKEE
jgi:hypothetical protein